MANFRIIPFPQELIEKWDKATGGWVRDFERMDTKDKDYIRNISPGSLKVKVAHIASKLSDPEGLTGANKQETEYQLKQLKHGLEVGTRARRLADFKAGKPSTTKKGEKSKESPSTDYVATNVKHTEPAHVTKQRADDLTVKPKVAPSTELFHLTGQGTATRRLTRDVVGEVGSVPKTRAEVSKVGGFTNEPATHVVDRTYQKQGRGWAGRDTKKVITDNPRPAKLSTFRGVDPNTGEVGAPIEVTMKTLKKGTSATTTPKQAKKANAAMTRVQLNPGANVKVQPAPSGHRAPTTVTRSGRPGAGERRRPSLFGPKNDSIVNFAIALGKYLTEHRYD